MNKFVLWFTKITAYFPFVFRFRRKIYFLNKRYPWPKKAIVISNHTSVYDYAVCLFLFFTKNLYFVAGENLFQKKTLSRFITHLGALKTDRQVLDMSYMKEATNILFKNNYLLIFPEGKLNPENQDLPYYDSYIRLSLTTDTPIIPLYTIGDNSKVKSSVIVGEPVKLEPLWNYSLSEGSNIENINQYFKSTILSLKSTLDEKG
jgi:1-acyl-sn-glycerol-3-phosphate acyltransferase